MPNEGLPAANIVRHALMRDGIELLCCGRDLSVRHSPEGRKLIIDSQGTRDDTVGARSWISPKQKSRASPGMTVEQYVAEVDRGFWTVKTKVL